MHPDAEKPHHPIHHTTIDILGEIFVHCLAEVPPNRHPDDLRPHNVSCWISETQITLRQKQPFRLAAVCSNWRAACLSTPRVWQNLDISLNGPALIRAGAAATMVHDVLRYSGAITLTISMFHWLFSTDRDQPWDSPEVELLVAALQAAMARCGTLIVSGHISRHLDLDPLGRILRADTPQLRAASLCGEFWVSDADERPDPPPEACILPNVSRLHVLEVDGSFIFGLKNFASCIDMHKANLRVNTWAGYNRDIAFKFLSTAPRLTTVIVDNPIVDQTEISPPRATSCDSVRKIIFNVDCDTHVRHWAEGTVELDLSVMLQLSFPRLEVIELRGCDNSAAKCITLLRHLVSPKHTTHVVLHAMCSTIEFLPAFEQARKLRHLTLTGLVFESRDQFADWCGGFLLSAQNYGARWRQELEELFLHDVVFNAPWNEHDDARLAHSMEDTPFSVFPHLKRFEVVEKGTLTSHNTLSCTTGWQSTA